METKLPYTPKGKKKKTFYTSSDFYDLYHFSETVKQHVINQLPII